MPGAVDIFETDRDLEQRFAAGELEAEEQVTIDVDDDGDETPCQTQVMDRPPTFDRATMRPSVRVPVPGVPVLVEERESEPQTLTGLHGLHDLIADEEPFEDTQPFQHTLAMGLAPVPRIAAPAPVVAAAPARVEPPRVRPSAARIVTPLPSVMVEEPPTGAPFETSSIAPLAMDVDETTVPREIVFHSVLKSEPPPPPSPFDDDGRSNATAVLLRPPVRRSPFVAAALGLAAAVGIAATLGLVMTWRSTTVSRRAAHGAPAAVATADAPDAGR